MQQIPYIPNEMECFGIQMIDCQDLFAKDLISFINNNNSMVDHGSNNKSEHDFEAGTKMQRKKQLVYLSHKLKAAANERGFHVSSSISCNGVIFSEDTR